LVRPRACYNRQRFDVSLQNSLFDAQTLPLVTAPGALIDSLTNFRWHDRATRVDRLSTAGADVPVFVNEFWTSRQRAANSLHEVSYRACFKPQLPAFFLDLLSRPGDVVYDPFAGRGTTLIEAALRERIAAGCDVNPLSHRLVLPRLRPPTLQEVAHRLSAIDLTWHDGLPEDLLAFYHPDTLAEICALRAYLNGREAEGRLDAVDTWIRMVAVNRLTGHSTGFLSVYTLPPNQAVSIASQQKINRERSQTPPRRETRDILLKKTGALLQDVDAITRARLARVSSSQLFHTGRCDETFWPANSVRLIVTSPPFLDVVDYAADNWLRCWFCGIAADQVALSVFRKLDEWSAYMERAFRQFHRLLHPGAFVAFEVGEVRGGAVKLEERVVPAARSAGFTPVCIVVNAQAFTKTAKIWGVANNAKGTNTNRIVVLQKPNSHKTVKP
jgi:hypothetical protein